MKTKVTNFRGDLDTPCMYCNQPHRQHLTKLCTLEGEIHWHHEPCDAQIKALRLVRAPANGVIPRLLRSLFPNRAA